MARHEFTKEEAIRGAASSKRSRAKILREVRKLTGIEIEGQTIDSAIKMLTVWVSTPLGQLVTAFLVINLLERTNLLAGIDAGHLKGVIIGADVISALGASGLVPQVGSLVAALK